MRMRLNDIFKLFKSFLSIYSSNLFISQFTHQQINSTNKEKEKYRHVNVRESQSPDQGAELPQSSKKKNNLLHEDH